MYFNRYKRKSNNNILIKENRKKFSKFEIATIKRTAQSVNPMVSKKAKLKEQIDALQAEYDQLNTMQEQYEASIKTMTGGYGTEDLVDKVIETTSAVDKNGKPIKVTKYVLKYPETVIPVAAEEIEGMTASEVDDTAVVEEVETPKDAETPVSPFMAE